MRMRVALAASVMLALPGLAAAKPPPGSDLGKVSSALLDLRAEKVSGGDAARLARVSGLRLSSGDRVLVDVYVEGGVGAAASALRIEGMDVEATADEPFAIVEGRLPLAAIDNAAALDRVRAIVAVRPAGVDVGSVTSEGDGAHRGPAARALGPTGAGVVVGVISDSINQVDGGVAESVGDGDLPPDVQVLNDDASGVDEGRAMAEIIYDTAPGIPRLVFSSGTAAGAVGKAAAIDALSAAGARVIADDIFYLDEPFFQDGAVAQAVDRARAGGVAYFASAGNRARQSYEATYADDGGLHNFAGGDNRQLVMNVPAAGSIRIMVQWDEPFGAVQTDLDARLYRAGLPAVVAADTSDSIQNDVPTADLSWFNAGAAQEVELEITRAAGTRTPFMKYILFDDAPGVTTIAEYNTASDAINPDAASARGALATAAVRWNQPGLNVPEPFSSRGPKTRIFDTAGNRLATPEVRQKPQIAAADGVSTGVAGFGTFSGTSAAAPSAAGLGALILSAKPTNVADDVYAILQQPPSSIDCALTGRPDLDCGMGFVLADTALQQALDATPPTVTSALSPPTPNGGNGFYVKQDVTASFAASDDGSPVTGLTGCDPVTVIAGTPPEGTTFSCTARSTGGTTTLPVTVKRDDTAPQVGSIRAARKGTRIRFNLSEPATVRITVERRRRGRFRRVRRFSVDGGTGQNRADRGRPRRAKAGRYRLKIEATDLAGNRSSAARKRFRVRN